MTDVLTPPASEPEPAPPPAASRRPLLIAAVVTVLVLLGLTLLVRRWVRSGGARRVITELAEEGAVKLADAVVDEVLPAA